MHSTAFIALGIGFIIMAGGLLALTLRKPEKAASATPNTKQLREQAAMAEEKKKMHIAAGATAVVGLVFVILGLF